MSTPLLAYHGDPLLKESTLAVLRAHREADEIWGDILLATEQALVKSKAGKGWACYCVACDLLRRADGMDLPPKRKRRRAP